MNCKEHHLPELELATAQVREALQVILHTILFIRSPGTVAPCDVHCEGFDLSYTRIANDEANIVSPSSSTKTKTNTMTMGSKSSTGANVIEESSYHSSNHYQPPSTRAQTQHTHPIHQHPIPYRLSNIGRKVHKQVLIQQKKIISHSQPPSSKHNQHTQQKPTHRNYIDQKVDDSIEMFLRTLTQIGPELLQGCLTLSFFERRASRQLFGLVAHEEKVIWEQWILHLVVNNTPRPVNDDSASVMERQRIQDTAEGMLRSVLMSVYESARSGGGIDGMNDGDGGDNLDHIPPVMYEFDIQSSKRADDRENFTSIVTNMPSLLNLDGS